jgi:hypothetical protein
MNKYYIRENDESIGPLTTEQLKTKNITKETWVWKEGLEDWVQIKDLKELELFFKTVRKPLVPIGKNWLFRAYIVIGLLGVFGLTVLLASSKDDRQNFVSPNIDVVKEKSQEPIVKKSIHRFTEEESKHMESTSSSQSKVDAFIEENSAPKSHPKQNALDAFIEQNGSKKSKQTKSSGSSSKFMKDLEENTDFGKFKKQEIKDPTFVGPEQVTFK